MLLARSVIVVKKLVKVRYIQVASEVTKLPNMERAFTRAVEISKEK